VATGSAIVPYPVTAITSADPHRPTVIRSDVAPSDVVELVALRADVADAVYEAARPLVAEILRLRHSLPRPSMTDVKRLGAAFLSGMGVIQSLAETWGPVIDRVTSVGA
jgi:hypothetical protein